MKKGIAALTAAFMLAGVLALVGCGGSGSSQASSSGDSSAATSQAATSGDSSAAASAPAAAGVLAPGEYTADFKTDSSMFHVNETKDGKGTLTVQEDGQMTIHVTLVSKRIDNLYLGTAKQAEGDESNWLQPTLDSVKYDDGYEEEVYGFDIIVPALDEEFDVALIGDKGKWYDHKVVVSNPEPIK